MNDFDTAAVCFFVAIEVAGYCLPSLGLVVAGSLGVIGMTAIHVLGAWLDDRHHR